MFAFPSVFEGFGMPAVEALGFDLPTLTTRRTAIPETTLGLAHYVEDPSDVDEWAERIIAMARDPTRHRPGEAGAARVRSRYAPDRIARAYARACAT
jgi:glycosyltransferase involved in cell wall biosynthesis